MMTPSNDPTTFALVTVDPTWKQALQVWWAFQWRVIVASLVLGFLIGGLASIMLGILGASLEIRYYVIQTVRFVIYVSTTLYFIKDFLDRDFGSFRVGVVPKKLPDAAITATAGE